MWWTALNSFPRSAAEVDWSILARRGFLPQLAIQVLVIPASLSWKLKKGMPDVWQLDWI